MRVTLTALLGGQGVLLVGVGLLGTLVGVRAAMESFGNLEVGLVMAAYYVGYILGAQHGPGIISRVGHIRSFAAFAALAAVSVLAFGLWVNPWAWFVFRLVNGAAVVGIYMVVESWLIEQTPGPLRARIFSIYMTITLVALAAGQALLVTYPAEGSQLFALATILVMLGLIPIAITRVKEPLVQIPAPLALGRLVASSPLGVAGALVAGVVQGIFWGLTPVFAQRLAMAPAEIALLMGATIIGGAVLQYPIGHLSDSHDRRRVLVATSLGGAAAALAAGWIVMKGVGGLPAMAFLYGGLMFSLYGLSVAHTNDHLDAGHTLSATRALLMVYGVGAFLGPLLGGAAMKVAGPLGLPVISGAMLVILAVFGLVRMLLRAAPAIADQAPYVPMVRTTPMVLEMHPEAEVEPELDLTGGGAPHQDQADRANADIR